MKRDNGTGTIRQRKNGTWEGQYWYFGKRKSVYGKTFEDVSIKLNAILAEIQNETYQESSTMTLQDWIEIWLQDYARPTIRHSTYLSYVGYCYNHIVPEIGKKRLKDVSVGVLQKFFSKKATSGRLDGEEGGLSPKTLRNIKNMLNLIFKQAQLNQMIPMNPVAGVKLPQKEYKEMRVLSLQEQDALENVIRSSLNPVSMGIIIALNTGLRIGELMGLQWQDVDMENSKCIKIRRILVRQEKPPVGNSDYEILTEGDKTALMLGKVKTHKGNRTIYLTNDALMAFRILRTYQNKLKLAFGPNFNPKGFVLCNEQGMPIEPRTYMDIFYKYINVAGIDHANFHSLRHTFATRALELGMDINTLADTLGHAQASTTLNIYGHSLEEQKRHEMDKFNHRPRGGHFAAAAYGGTERRLAVVQNEF